MCDMIHYDHKVDKIRKNSDGTYCILCNRVINEMNQYEYEIHKKTTGNGPELIDCMCLNTDNDDGNYYGNGNEIILKIDDQYKLCKAKNTGGVYLYKLVDGEWKNVGVESTPLYNDDTLWFYDDGIYVVRDFSTNQLHIINFNKLYDCIISDDKIQNITYKLQQYLHIHSITCSKRRSHGENRIIFYAEYSYPEYSDPKNKEIFFIKFEYDTIKNICIELARKKIQSSDDYYDGGEMILACLYDGNILYKQFIDVCEHSYQDYYTVLLDSNFQYITTISGEKIERDSFIIENNDIKLISTYNNTLLINYNCEMGSDGFRIYYGFEWGRRKYPIISVFLFDNL